MKPIGLLFTVYLAAGLSLVHLPNGWFVVVLGRNGTEYSVLPSTCFAAATLTQTKWK